MLALCLALALAAPAAEGPAEAPMGWEASDATGQDAAATGPPVEDTVIAPVEITPPPPREPGPRDAGAEPAIPGDRVVESRPAAPELGAALALPPPPPPPDGAGRLVGGSLAVALGLGAASVIVAEATRADGNPEFVASTFIPLGLISLGVGTYVLIRGTQARANFLGWQDYTGASARPTGNGLLVGGVMGLVVGSVTLVAASVQLRDASGGALAPALFGLAGVGLLGGGAALTAGLLRRGRYRAWRQSTFLGARTLLPAIAPRRGGLTLGLTGRF